LFVVALCIVYHMLPVSLDCPFFISHSLLPIRFSLTYIYIRFQYQSNLKSTYGILNTKWLYMQLLNLLCLLKIGKNYTIALTVYNLGSNSTCDNISLLWRQRLYWYRFCLSLYIYQVPEKLYWVQDETTLKYIWPPLLGLKITQLQDKICYTYNIWYTIFRQFSSWFGLFDIAR
jgi:hypothetical protein